MEKIDRKPLLIKSKADLTLLTFNDAPGLSRNQILLNKISAHLKTMSVYLERARVNTEPLTRPDMKSAMVH